VLIAPCGGGSKLANGTIQVVTPHSPLGRGLLGKRPGDECEVAVGGKIRQLAIVRVL
jgi:transcription elongation GreA/GreB family factor